MQIDTKLRQLAPQDLRNIPLRPALKVIERIEPESASGRRTRCPAARCVADALLMRPICSVGRPVQGESLAMRASPLSITAVTPSIVIELSATLVASISLRLAGAGDGAILFRGCEIAMQGKRE